MTPILYPLLAQTDFPPLPGADSSTASPDHYPHDPAPVPEPSTYGLFAVGLALLVWVVVAWKRRVRAYNTFVSVDVHQSPSMLAALTRRRLRAEGGRDTHAAPILDHGEWLGELSPEEWDRLKDASSGAQVPTASVPV